MSRSEEGLKKAIGLIKKLREEFHSTLYVPGTLNEFNPELEKAYRVADFLELGELMCIDALSREESCGCHARVEHLTANGEVQRHDNDFGFVSAWQFTGDVVQPKLVKEPLHFDFVSPGIRNYQ